MERSEIIKELKLTPFGTLGWLTNRGEVCPFCGKKDKWGLYIGESGGVFHCWKCDKKTNLYNYLKEIGRLDLFGDSFSIGFDTALKPLYEEEVEDSEDKIIAPPNLPLGCQKIENDEYLASRNFLPEHYVQFQPVETRSILESRLSNYIIFQIFQNRERVAWLARSRYSKEWHKENLEKCKVTGERPLLRYENSRCDFSKIVGGIDTVQKGVEVLFIVEGLFDKVGLDNLLNVYKNPQNFGVVFTFGKSISRDQIDLIMSKSPKSVILMWDEDATEQIKDSSLRLSHYVETYCCKIDNPDIDPGNMDKRYLNELLSHNLYAPIDFSLTFSQKRLG